MHSLGVDARGRRVDDPAASLAYPEVAVQLVTLVGVAAVTFTVADPMLGWLPALPVAWSAVRFGLPVTLAEVAGLAGAAALAAILGSGPLGAEADPLGLFGPLAAVCALCLLLAWYAQRPVGRLSLHDPLTGLPSRTLLVEHVAYALTARERSGGDVALLHVACRDEARVDDRLVADVAGRLRHNVRESDTVARLRGAEFAVLCPGVDGPSEADLVADRLRSSLTAPCDVDGLSRQLTTRVGASVAGPHTPPETLLRDAEEATFSPRPRRTG